MEKKIGFYVLEGVDQKCFPLKKEGVRAFCRECAAPVKGRPERQKSHAAAKRKKNAGKKKRTADGRIKSLTGRRNVKNIRKERRREKSRRERAEKETTVPDPAAMGMAPV